MSFILDALKKSETERQRQGTAEFAGVPTSTAAPGAPRWLWIVGLLLAVNLAVLLGLWLRPDVRTSTVATPVTERPSVSESPAVALEAEPQAAIDGDFIAQVEAARQNPPARQEAAADRPAIVPAAAPPRPGPVPVQSNVAGLPTVYEVITNGTLQLPDLHIDLHVYSDVPEDRFVFINMSKQRENSQLSEGPVVEEITPDGVVLEHLGTRFFVPRD